MEAAVCNSSSEKTQDESSLLSAEKEGVASSEAKFISSLPVNNYKMDFSYEEKTNVNDHMNDSTEKAESQDISEPLSQKSFSPTLIESAFKVMKNLFSPEKSKNKSSNISPIRHHGSASGSPCRSVFVPNKSGFSTSDPELPNNNYSTENFLKGDNLNINQLGILHSSHDPHNNTGDSFLTTVSLIDDSFHSAVTHIDENGEVLGSGKLSGSVLNDSQNLDLLESHNNTFENSGYSLDNTMFENCSFKPNRTKLGNILCEGKEGKLETLDSTQVVFNDGKDRAGFENSKKASVTEYKDDILKENDINVSNKIEKNVEGKLVEFSPNKHAVIEKPQEAKNQTEGQFIINVLNNKRNIKMEDLFVNKIYDKQLSPAKNSETEASKLIENSHDSCLKARSMEEDEKLNTIEKEEIKTIDDLSETENWNENVGGSISTTTIVLNGEDSVELGNMLPSLKGEDSETNTSLTSFEANVDIKSVSLENLIDKELESSSKESAESVTKSESKSGLVKNISLLGIPRGKKSKSEGNSPNKSAVPSRNLYKSVDFIHQKIVNKSPKDKKDLQEGLRIQSSMDISVIKNNDVSDKVINTAASLNSSNVTSEIETILGPLTLNIGDTVHQNFEKPSQLDFGKSEVGLSIDESDAVFVISQQSYTILNSPNSNIKRPMIDSTNSDQALDQECGPINNDVTDATFYKDLENKDKVSTPPNDDSNISPNTVLFGEGPKQSTPLCGGNIMSKSLKPTPSDGTQTFIQPTSLCFQSPEKSSEDKIETQNDIKSGANYSTPDLLGKAMLIFSSNQESDFSPVIPTSDSQLLLSAAVDKDVVGPIGDISPDVQNSTWDFSSKSPKEMNQTFKKQSKSPNPNKQHQTHHKNQILAETIKLNQTFDKSPEILLLKKTNQIFDKDSESQTPHQLNQTFDKKMEPPNIMNVTYEKDRSVEKNETFKLESTVTHMPNQEEMDKSFETKGNSENSSAKKNTESTMSEANSTKESSLKSEIPSDTENVNEKTGESIESGACKDDLNESFISTTSSNTSLISNVTVLLNHGPVLGNKINNEGGGKFEKVNLTGEVKKEAGTEESFDTTKTFPTSTKIEEGHTKTAFTDDNLPLGDVDLAQLIQEQFSCTDIEKICSVVDDMSYMKLSNQILKASEQFEKSFHEHINKSEKKYDQKEIHQEKLGGILTPQSLDFLGSIGGKPTGRDLSRESLYVKFDPLVQAPIANSLIDFSKEVEALAAVEASPKADDDGDVCEQLLAISPQRKADEIVPPLTPISHRNSDGLKLNKTEKIKELQNEIYFLKNLYTERERSNKTKMEDYESQIAKLTGQNCIFEDKLKASNEREKSLVKKLKEQTQNISQLKVIMEEYVTVISRLTSELETLKNENLKQIDALTSEKDSYVTHLQNTEAAFTDVHAKYEKSKKTIVNLKANEVMYRNTISDQMHKLEDFKKKAKEAQEKAYKEFQMIQEELNETKANHTHETTRLRAQLRKTELKLEALQESLDQKIKENEQLTAICDDLIEGKN